MTDTPHLGLPTLAAAQAQKHVTHNEALHRLDALVMLAVADRDLAAPPAAPAEGDRYLVPTGAAGGFAGRAGQIAHYVDGGWDFYAPRPGWLCWVADEGVLLAWTGAAWRPVVETGLTGAALQNLGMLGVGTTADAGNPFAVKLNNALWAARGVGEGGDGSLRYKLNKESAAGTLSLLMQTAWSGRAEIGLAGDDDLRFKVSPDGAAWFDALRIDRASGRVFFPATGGPREVLTADREYFVRTDGSDTNVGALNSPGGAFRTFQCAVDVVRETLDLAGRAVTIRAGNAGVFGGVTVRGPLVGARGPDALALIGDTTDPTRVVMQTADATSVMRGEDGAQFTASGFKLTSMAGVLIDAARFSSVMVQGPMDFGATGPAGDHLFARRMSYLGISGAYTISGGGRNHYRAANNSIVSAQSVTVTAIGTPAFSQAVIGLTAIAELILTPATFAGSINGPQYIIDANSVLIAPGTVLPGSSPGALATGGQIA
ncbi:hypothetical protein RHODGE_RHODGE_04389 [Rhodoplanes serenus]|uniref:DUF2793 domain-containing protein n=1 Tax=Rhodoplanes serenus TaxID=200615 RepID=A0A3S4CJL7_9BRAD|nr:DUF2793 domain-containing protein [Rhodoplanes serenus]VCU10824.1 hypothetical protein RHODGE_RHODGE_04389 [Rhodoplanes serenus]